MNDSFQSSYNAPWEGARLMLAAGTVAFVVLLLLMLLAWRNRRPFDGE